MKKYVEEYEMETGKVSRPVRLVMVSDLHLGYHNRSGELARWIEKINSMKPDMVLCAGDIIDFSTKPLLEGGFAEEFRKLDAPIYTCLGNHDHYAGTGKAMEFFSDAGIITLTDSTLLFNSELRPTSDSDSAMLAVTGRDDYSSSRSRKSLDELMPKGRPFTIVLDHEPYRLEEAEKAGVDFQFSGHVHYGQVWPISWITRAIFEQAYGHLTKGGTEYYVTSGLGIWGAKIRIGTRSEYFVLDIKPASK
jgi:predicted MPP superfamily phosphohydrolase